MDRPERGFLIPSSPKMAAHLAHRIHGEIRAANMANGTVLGSEPLLVARYGVSRAVFREAVRLLEHHQVAEMRRGQGGGLTVTEPDPVSVTQSVAIYLDYQGMDIHQIFEARTTVELRIIELAAGRIDETGINRLRQALDHEAEHIESLKAATDTGEPQLDRDETVHELHAILAELSGNEALRLFAAVLERLIPQYLAPEIREPGNLVMLTQEVHREHVAIIGAIVNGDVGLARYRMSKHLDRMHDVTSRSPGQLNSTQSI